MDTSDDPMLNVAQVVPRTEAEGPGVRFAIWVQGCPLRCAGCCNPEMLAFGANGETLAASELARRAVGVAGVEGVTLLGGEPFAQAAGLARVARDVRAAGLSVMAFSGFTLAELRARSDTATDALLAALDLLVDGPYLPTRRTTARRWIGSDNQVMHFLTDRYAPEDPRFAAPNHLEIRLRAGEITFNGWPVLGARTRAV
jgi:anaerobic ribonucleoside-triphosphate reductase activating protein